MKFEGYLLLAIYYLLLPWQKSCSVECTNHYMKNFTAAFILIFLAACNEAGTEDAASPGTLPSENGRTDTSLLITDSVRIKDTNTADIEPMKKIN